MLTVQVQPFLATLPLLSRVTSTPQSVPLIPQKGKDTWSFRNKLLIGPCGSGVGFLTKYMLLEGLKGPIIPYVLFLDESNNFHLPQDYSQVFANKRDAAFHLHRMGNEPYLPSGHLPEALPAGITLVKIDHWWHIEGNIERLLQCLNDYFIYFIGQCVAHPGRSHVLVLDRYWPIILSKRGGSLWHLFRDLMGTLQTHPGEVWLQTDGLTWIEDLLTHDPASRQRWDALQDFVGTKMLFQDQWYHSDKMVDRVRRIYRMNADDVNLLMSLNRNLRSEAGYKEVMIRQSEKQAVYGVKADFETRQLIG
ncbi:MAG: hypothetical protein JWP57_278 [Spirosoma sp.]|nr:hypothetical protein [Spirosoma sp.]